MPLIKAQCTNCNAVLEVDKEMDAAICPNCGTAYIIEKAIHNYNINYGTKEDSASSYLKNGVTLLKFRDYAKAKKVFNEMTTKHAGDWRGWLGLSLASNEERSAKLPCEDNIRELAPKEILRKLGEMIVYNEDVYEKEKYDYVPVDAVEKKLEQLDDRVTRSAARRRRNSVFTVLWWAIAALIVLFGVYKLVKGDIILGLIVTIIPFAASNIIGEVVSFLRPLIPEAARIDEGAYENLHDSLQKELYRAKQRDVFERRLKESGRPLDYYIGILEME